MKKDWVALIEAGYRLENTDELWLKNILTHAAPLFDRGFWPTAGIYHFTSNTLQIRHIASQGPSKAVEFLRASLNSHDVNPEAADLFFRRGLPICSLSGQVFSRWPDLREPVRHATNGLVQDKLAIKSLTGQRSALIMCQLFSHDISPTPLERRRWPLITSHLGAGLRLREIGQSINVHSSAVEAVFDAGGKLLDARRKTQSPPTRERLRGIVRQIEKVRTRKGRSDPDSALKLWEGLIHGRWSLVNYVDTDRRRFVLAIKNDPTYPDLRGLSEKEQQVAEFMGLGLSNKEISYTLGVSLSAVTNCTASAKMKLGLTSRAELVAFFSPSGLRTTLADISLAGEELLVGGYPLIDQDCVGKLTEAERAVLVHLVSGSTNVDIAKRRDTSDRTVANQVQSIFRKLQVTSRSELAVRLQSTV